MCDGLQDIFSLLGIEIDPRMEPSTVEELVLDVMGCEDGQEGEEALDLATAVLGEILGALAREPAAGVGVLGGGLQQRRGRCGGWLGLQLVRGRMQACIRCSVGVGGQSLGLQRVGCRCGVDRGFGRSGERAAVHAVLRHPRRAAHTAAHPTHCRAARATSHAPTLRPHSAPALCVLQER